MSVLATVDDWPVDTVAIGVTDATTTLEVHGPTDQPFPLASVTKPLAAYAFLLAVDHGRLDLDEQADEAGATVRDLLSHAGGYPFDGTEPRSAPRTRRIYSNTGFEILGELVEDRVGRPVASWLHQQVLLPLEMSDTRLDGSPAKDGRGSVDDLLRFARELLAPTLLDEELAEAAVTVQHPGLDGVLPGFGRQTPNDWGLGFELRDQKSPHWTGARNSQRTFGHFGQSGSFLWVDPVHGIAAASLADRAFGDWARELWPPCSDAIIERYGST